MFYPVNPHQHSIKKNSIVEDHVNFLTVHLAPKVITKHQIEDACQKDAEIQALIRLLDLTAGQENRWHKALKTHEMSISILSKQTNNVR